MTGYTQIYTGNGKGKTTAALGLTMRAAAAGLRVYIGQFIKGKPTGEVDILNERFAEVTIEQYGIGGFILGNPTQQDIDAASRGLRALRDAMLSQEYDVVVADEINNAVSLKLVTEDDLVSLVREKPAAIELILTGRSAPDSVVEQADLVTEMKQVKHYSDKGVTARRGIEK